MNFNFDLQRSAIVTSAFAVLAVSAYSQVNNAGFEAGNFSGWTTAGDTLVIDNTLGTGPVEGTYQAFLATSTDGSVNTNIPVGSGVGLSSVASGSGLTSLALSSLATGSSNTINLGSVIYQSVSLLAGQQVTVRWNFLTNQTYFDGTNFSYAPDANNNDFSFFNFSLAGQSNNFGKLADTFDGYAVASNAAGFVSGFSATTLSNPFVSETGFRTSTFTATASGTYDLAFGVVNANNGSANGINSALLVDNIQVSPVPEPASMLALGAGVLGLIGKRRKKAA